MIDIKHYIEIAMVCDFIEVRTDLKITLITEMVSYNYYRGPPTDIILDVRT